MRELLQLLISRQQATIARSQDDSETLNTDRQKLVSLVLADAALGKAATSARYPGHPTQIVVIGPTQVGKSSIVNMLIGQKLADASPVAGYTVHCQGYLLTGNEKTEVKPDWLEDSFSGQEQRSRQALDRNLLTEYSLSAVQTENSVLQDMIVWDTPDFDSVDSLSYSVPVLRAIALADLVVLVVSKEKYADKSVWNLLRLLNDLNVPLIPVMNKTPVPVRAELSESFQAKYARIAPQQSVPKLRFVDDFRDQIEQSFSSAEVQQLRADIAAVVSRRSSDELQGTAVHFARQHWHDWTESVVAEHQLLARWKTDVDLACDEAIQIYQREYLQHDRYKETFQLALAELLTLLEVPGFAEPITRLRNLVTWPVRKLKEAAESQQQAHRQPQDDRTEERRLLEELGEHVLTQLSANCLDRQTETDYWKSVADQLAMQQTEIVDAYHRGLDSYQIMLQGEVERAAQSLYRKLQEQPATLNKLRAARVTADAAAIVLAVKSGGLGAIDLVLAPAMLSLTTMLTEGALGKYMDGVQNDLRDYQQREMAVLINKKFRGRLKLIGADADGSSQYHVSEKQLAAVASALENQNAV